MGFTERIRALVEKLPEQLERAETEEATKNALVMPFIGALGYDVFDLNEVVPEFVADVGIKKGEKVDYAIMRDGKPMILIETKKQDTDLEVAHASQLYRYFSASDVRFAVLTNGTTYQFYSDLDKPNRMDSRPFFVFDLLDFDESDLRELEQFSKESFDEGKILETANLLKYTRAIKQTVAELWEDPTDEFVRFLARKHHKGRFSASARALCRDAVRIALREFLHDKVKARLESALAREQQSAESEAIKKSAEKPPAESAPAAPKRGVHTTREEIEAFYIVKSILRDVVDVRRIELRDGKMRCSVLLDNTNRKPICRFYFDGKKMKFGTIDKNKKERKYKIRDLDDIYKYATKLASVVFHYDQDASAA